MDIKGNRRKCVRKKGIRKKSVLMLLGCMMIVGAVAFLFRINKAYASNAGYFATYTDVANIESNSIYTSAQGMSIYDGKVYYIRTESEADYKKAYSQIWTLDMKTGEQRQVYNVDEDRYVFKVGHANSLYVDGKYMYIATQLSNEPSIYRYSLWWEEDICYMEDVKKYNVYSSKSEDRGLTAITGIEYAKELGGFLVKNGMTLYLGNFKEDEFVWDKTYTLKNKIVVYTDEGTEYIDLSNSKYIMQGMYYNKGYIYIPMTNKSNLAESIVVVYPINKSYKSGREIEAVSAPFIRISGADNERIFEIEEVASYNGAMYASVNAQSKFRMGRDKIIQINDFRMEE